VSEGLLMRRLRIDKELAGGVGRAGRGKGLARGTSLTDGKTNRENAEYIRQVLSRPDSKIRINGKLY